MVDEEIEKEAEELGLSPKQKKEFIKLEKENAELKSQVELNSSIANSFQQKICILEKENAELHKLIKDYENDSVETLCKINDLKAQFKKMKRCGNCKHYSFHLNVCHAHERRVWKTFEDTISCSKWELAE